jgi:uncharacterized Zn finger protein (UPF0148 family)
MSLTYDVIFQGLRSDSSENRDRFISTLAQAHKISNDKFAFLRDQQNVSLYSNLDSEAAKKTAVWLENLGALVTVKPSREPEEKRKLAYRKCPACGAFNRLDTVYCSMCKVDFRTIKEDHPSGVKITKSTESREVGSVSANQFIKTGNTVSPDDIPPDKNPAGVDFRIFSAEPVSAHDDEKIDKTQPIDLIPLPRNKHTERLEEIEKKQRISGGNFQGTPGNDKN